MLLRWALVCNFFGLLLAGCVPVHATGPGTAESAALREVAELEPLFQSFVNTPIAGRGPAQSLDNLEFEIERLSNLRERYLDALTRHAHTEYGILVLARIAEMHLELAARARSLPPPVDASRDEATAFYAITEVYAVPLERLGVAVLQEADRVGASIYPGCAWLTRIRLYLALYDSQRYPEHRRNLYMLRRQVAREVRFGPPTILLDPQRLAPRAAQLID